ncbi:hypothetical protein VTL71DRAFT_11067 [Oculimacula yallundae]|uniref:Uncharacterized protein n=1 Tax=Oculimacula yallundae TaxID=86028 RepID=A0ABR4CX48_9HELO
MTILGRLLRLTMELDMMQSLGLLCLPYHRRANTVLRTMAVGTLHKKSSSAQTIRRAAKQVIQQLIPQDPSADSLLPIPSDNVELVVLLYYPELALESGIPEFSFRSS